MKCPFCDHSETSVIQTSSEASGRIRRRRKCNNCDKRFSTLESPVGITPAIIKNTGEREEFDRDKLVRGIRMACTKRPVSMEAINALADRVEHHLQSLGLEEVPAKEVGDMTIAGLKDLDPIAYIRYAIVYLKLDNLEAVRAETDKLLQEQEPKA
jgi:transcriptional repressor NrdR